MNRLDTTGYRLQLVSFQEHMALIDGGIARVIAKWISALDEISTDGVVTRSLVDQINEVHRSVAAFSILAESRITKDSHPGFVEALEANVSDMLAEISSLSEACAKIDQVVSDRGLQMIVGQFLSSVTFVMDYLQFDFCGYVLTVYVNPTLTLPQKRLEIHDEGYRDSLCSFISANVLELEVLDGQEINISFSYDRCISLSLRPEDANGPENVQLNSPSGLCTIW